MRTFPLSLFIYLALLLGEEAPPLYAATAAQGAQPSAPSPDDSSPPLPTQVAPDAEATPEKAPSKRGPSPDLITPALLRARSLGLAHQRMWHILVRYQEGFFGGHESEADGPDFFLSPEGKENPTAELESTLRAMLEPATSASAAGHAQCRFPARFKWLQSALAWNENGWPVVECPEVQHYLRTMEPERVVLVFASSYLNAPPSMFGHTFLRFDHRQHPDTLMLSNIINFAANPTTRNPFAYTVLGIFGGFKARFAGMPYYAKIREYSDMESRDLWEYELNLSMDQMDWILRMSWDLNQTYFDYFFFKENCSYHVLDLLQIAFPQMDTSEYLSAVSLPTDTIKLVLAQQNASKEPVYRPSHLSKMEARRAHLTGNELDLATALSEEGAPDHFLALEKMPLARQAWVLDAAHDRFKYETGFSDSQKEEAEKKFQADLELKLLRARKKLKQAQTQPTFAPGAPPHRGHGARRIGLGVGSRLDGRVFGELWWRRAFHDLLDQQDGFVRDSHLEMFSVRLRLQPQNYLDGGDPGQGLLIERLDLLRLASIFSMTPWVNPFSWRLNLHYSRVADLDCYTWECTAVTLEGGPGVAGGASIWGLHRWYGFADIQLSTGPAFEELVRASFGVSAGWLWEPVSFWRLQGEASVLGDFPLTDQREPYRVKVLGASQWALGQDLALRVQVTYERSVAEGLALLFFYH